MTDDRFKSFREFWPYYLSEHSRPATRALHLIGSVAALASLAACLVMQRWLLIPLAFIPGYGAAWIAHFFIEKNKPATFKYPLWSFLADYKMVGLMLLGKINAEVAANDGPQKSGGRPADHEPSAPSH